MPYKLTFGKQSGKATKVWMHQRKSKVFEEANKLSYVLWEGHLFKNSELEDILEFEDDEFFISIERVDYESQ